MLIPIASHVDDRGFLNQIYGGFEDKFPSVKRVYFIGNFGKGIIRGFHKHADEWKCYFVCNGSAKFVIVDENKDISAYTLSQRAPSVLIVPPTYFHGWASLEENTTLIGMSNKSLEESEADDVRIDPFTFGKEVWEVKPR
ncbi:MAG TPA: WxcM-like domain-containing protein [Acidobacteriota bacterium]|jgi:dTDP-4-dehydrorhamnose 3,5-epimerase-like enzyme|nr:WxcM-like domain-containing protein [Acidobacteriota bacterium]